MKLESQVASLELSRRLKAAGFPQDTLANWYTMHGEIIGDFDLAGIPTGDSVGTLVCDIKVPPGTATNGYDLVCAAPTVSEIVREVVPTEIQFTRSATSGSEKQWTVSTYASANDDEDEAEGDTLAEAAARLWLAVNGEGK